MDKKVTVNWSAQLATLFKENRKFHDRLNKVSNKPMKFLKDVTLRINSKICITMKDRRPC